MASFNRVILMGHLTRDPELRSAASGTTVAKVGLAVNERIPDGNNGYKDEASFVDIVIFGKRADAFGRFFKKGSLVHIEGKLRQGRWQDKETGASRSKIEIIVDNWDFCGGNDQGQRHSSPPDSSGAPSFPAPGDGGGIPDDVPF